MVAPQAPQLEALRSSSFQNAVNFSSGKDQDQCALWEEKSRRHATCFSRKIAIDRIINYRLNVLKGGPKNETI
jgi:hypothetical protein